MTVVKIKSRLLTLVSLVTAISVVSGVSSARADLKSYLAKPEPAFKWEKRGEKHENGVTIYDMHYTSQTWQGMNWEHRLMIFRPDENETPHFCMIYNTGGNGGGAENTMMGTLLAKRTKMTYAIVFNSPNQPLYGGKTEDALIVYTWQKYMETGDESWPLHFPMAKGVIKGMDVVQEFAKSEKMPDIDSFIVHGASKRGWTTWLVGASQDKRVKAIAPMVIDTLNVIKQMPHQLEAFGGKPSEQIGDYSAGGMLTMLNSPRGKRLMELEDPISYKDILTLPKLIILGTNDRYWAQDALNLYWDDLKGPKWVTYTPNSGHGLEDREHVFATLSSYGRMIAGGKKWPKMTWGYQPESEGTKLSVNSDTKLVGFRLYHASAPTQDLRDAKWSFEEIAPTGKTATATWKSPESGYTAVFGEAIYELEGQKYSISTQVRILGKGK